MLRWCLITEISSTCFLIILLTSGRVASLALGHLCTLWMRVYLQFLVVRSLATAIVFLKRRLTASICWILDLVFCFVLHLELALVIFGPTTLIYHFIFDDLVSLGLLLSLYIFLNGQLHALRNLLLWLGSTGGVIAGVVIRVCLRRLATWSGWWLQPWLFFEIKAPLHANFLASLANFRRKSTILYVFLKVLRVFVLILPVR